MTEGQRKEGKAARQSSELKWRTGTAGKCLARRACSAYLKKSLGTLVQALVSAMRARPAAARGREGPCLFRAQACPANVGLCTANPGRHPAKRRATRATTLGLAWCGSHRGCAPRPTRARIMRPPGSSSQVHASTPDFVMSKWDLEAAG